MNLGDIAAILKGNLIGDSLCEVVTISPITTPSENCISFILEDKHIPKSVHPNIKGIITFKELDNFPNQIVVKNPRKALAQTLEIFHPKQVEVVHFISDKSDIDQSCEIQIPSNIGPFCTIESQTRIGSGCKIHSKVSIGKHCKIGNNCVIFPSVTLYDHVEIGDNVIIHAGTVIGSDGFGYYPENKKWHKIPQIGKVIIENFVEIGANVSIDRGCIGNTLIKEGTKIDNLVHIAHNIKIGKNCVIAGQVGFSGSATLHDNIQIGGQAGIDAVEVSSNSVIAGKAGVTKNVKENSFVSGFPAWDHHKELMKEAFVRSMFNKKQKEKRGKQ